MSERLGVLLLPSKLEDFALADHGRRLLEIPRVVALEPSKFRVPAFLREAAPLRQARRMRLPGDPRVFVLYHPAQYRLARAFRSRYEQSELWYLRALDEGELREGSELSELDQLAQERAEETRVITQPEHLTEAEEALRLRLRALEVISHRPFVAS